DEVSFTNAAREEGWALGREEGQLKPLERLLQRKFGPLSDDIRTRLSKANEDQLSGWAENVLFASTLDEVFQ
ncbi:MAG: hypothetical protein CVU28_10900, partial [Betaproteobacteria bacterium HGW-Betaproteobacteria-21]